MDLSLKDLRVDITVNYLEEEAPCPECGTLCPIYDHQRKRTWRHMDTMQYETYLHSRTPRMKCQKHGVRNIQIPWAEKHARFTLLFEGHAIEVLQASRNIEEARKLLSINWHQAQSIMKRAVERGLRRRKDEEIPWLGMDEKSFRSKQSYVSLVNDLEGGRVIEVLEGRDNKTAEELLNKGLTENQREMVCGVALDMSAPFINAVNDLLPNADIVHDRFHISKHLNDAVDKVRRQENKKLTKKKDKRLVGTKYIWLSGMEHMSKENHALLDDLKKMNLNTSKAWCAKEMFRDFWTRRDKDYAVTFFDYWFREAIKSGLSPVKKVAYMLKKHLGNILTYFDSYITNAVSEGLNSKIQSIKANARGFRTFENYRISILFFCGKLSVSP